MKLIWNNLCQVDKFDFIVNESSDQKSENQEKGLTIDRRTILLNDPIKSLGDTKVMIKVGYQLNTEIIVQVVPETIGD